MDSDYRYSTDLDSDNMVNSIETKLESSITTFSGSIEQQISEYPPINHTHDFNTIPRRRLIYLTGASGIPCGDTDNRFTWSSEVEKDEDIFSFNPTTGEITVTSGGIYALNYAMNYENTTMEGHEAVVAVAKNTCDGVISGTKTYGYSPSSTYPYVDIERRNIIPLEANDKVFMRCLCDVGSGDLSDWYDTSFPYRREIIIDSSYVEGESNDIVVTDRDTQDDGGSSATLTFSLSANDDRILVVGITNEDPNPVASVTSCTFNGTPMTLADSTSSDNGSYHNVAYLYYMLEDDLPSSPGNYNIVVTMDQSCNDLTLGAFIIYNAKQQAPTATNTNDNTGSSTISTNITTSVNGAIIVDVAACGNASGFTANAGQTEEVEEIDGSSALAMSTKILSTAGSTSVGWTNSGANRLAQAVAVFAPAAANPLENFPVYVNIDGLSGKTTASDLTFADPDKNELDFEIENFDGDELHAWVRIPELSSNEDYNFFIYYGKSSGTGYDNPTGVWDSNYVMVQHMAGENSAAQDDSTSNNNDVTSEPGDPSYQQTGKLGYAINFDGNDALEVPDSTSLDITTEVTISAWINPTSISDWNRMVAKSHISNSNPWTRYGLLFDNNDHLRMEISNGSTQYGLNGGTIVQTGQWQYAVATFDGDVMKLYYNASEDGTNNQTTTITTNDMPLSIARSGFAADYFTGSLDEVRVSNVARSGSWIETEYNNQNSPNTFYTIEAEESVTIPFDVLGSQCLFKVEFIRGT